MDRINELIYLALEGIDNGQFEDSSLKCILKDTLSNMGLRVSDIVLFSYFEEIREKLGQISKLVRYVFIESEYNETAWKDMVALFYVNTMPNIKNSVIRVHMFKDIAEVESPSSLDLSDTRIYNACQNAYLGYFNIRPINSPGSCISYIMINYNNYSPIYNYPYGLAGKINMLTYPRNVHIQGYTFSINTFPYFGRDGHMIVCAQADMMMISRYVYRKLGLPELCLTHICANRSYDRLDIFPTQGITPGQMRDIFYERNIPIKEYMGSMFVDYESEPYNGFYSIASIGQLVVAMLDSGIPAMLNIGEHVIIANGISEFLYCKRDVRYHQRVIALYDDSGEFLNVLDPNYKVNNPLSFMGLFTWEEIEEGIVEFSSKIDNGIPDIIIMFPYQKRVSLAYFQLVNALAKMKKPIISDAEWTWSRIFLVDCNRLKEHFIKDSIPGIKEWKDKYMEDGSDKNEQEELFLEISMELYRQIISRGLPHYFWCLETPQDVTQLPKKPSSQCDSYCYYIFDAVPCGDRDIYNICHNIITIEDDGIYNRGIKLELENLSRIQECFGVNIEMFVPFITRQRIECY